MLQNLCIKNVALIERLDISFTEGFHVLTGETGAGKSIIIDAVNFVLGERATRDLIMTGTDKASVEAAFTVDEQPDLLQRLMELGIEQSDDDLLILTRELSMAGKSVCRINGTLVNLSALKSVSDLLVDVHGQHEHQSLLHADSHLHFLDAFDRKTIEPLRQIVADLYHEHLRIQKELLSGFSSEQDRLRRMDVLEYQIKEISGASLQIGEEEELDAQLLVLSNAQTIMAALEEGHALLIQEDDGALAKAGAATHQLDHIQSLHPDYADAYSRLQDAYYAMEDVAFTLRDLKNGFEFQPELLNRVENRLERIHMLKRKYGGNIKEILDFLDNAQKEYDNLQQSDARREKLSHALADCAGRYAVAAENLMSARQMAAKRLSKQLVTQLSDLGMEKSTFDVSLQPLSPGRLTSDGLERVEFLLSTNAGEPVKPLQRVASGGELSRIMLAFKTIHMGVIPTVIFDEIDTGISGHIATVVGNKMLQIAQSRQVLCITHLHQIASMADTHFLVEKLEQKGRTYSKIRKLDFEERVREIARIMGSDEENILALEHARELLKNAQELQSIK